jgi:hypothetical protein
MVRQQTPYRYWAGWWIVGLLLFGCGGDKSTEPEPTGAPPVQDTEKPYIEIIQPKYKEIVGNSFRIKAIAYDDVGIWYVAFYVNGAKKGTDSDAPYEWDCRAQGPQHLGSTKESSIKVIAYDTSNKYSMHTSVFLSQWWDW